MRVVAGGLLAALCVLGSLAAVAAQKPLPPTLPTGSGGPLSTSDPSLLVGIPCAVSQPVQTWNYLAAPGEGHVRVAVRVQGTGTVWLSVAGGTGAAQTVATGPAQQIVTLTAPLPGGPLGDQFAVGGNSAACPDGGLIVSLVTAHITP